MRKCAQTSDRHHTYTYIHIHIHTHICIYIYTQTLHLHRMEECVRWDGDGDGGFSQLFYPVVTLCDNRENSILAIYLQHS